MIEIPLTQGQVARIDDGDFDLVSPYTWCASKGRNTWYAVTDTGRVDGVRRMRQMHCMLMGVDSLNREVDHRDGNGLNNCRGNLRFATRRQQRQNQGVRSDSRSGIKGVGWLPNRRKWRASIRHHGKAIHIGVYSSSEDAARAYDAKARELFGEFARTND